MNKTLLFFLIFSLIFHCVLCTLDACDDNCDDCNDDNTCNDCDDSFLLSANADYCVSCNNVTYGFQNCESCNSSGYQCLNCSDGYTPATTNAGGCVECTSSGGVSNCGECHTDSRECFECNTNYTLLPTNSCILCNDTTLGVINCAACSNSSFACETCNTNYTLLPLVKTCALCNGTFGVPSCSDCSTTSFECNQCNPGYTPLPDVRTCTSCNGLLGIPGCAECNTTEFQCLTCATNYTLTPLGLCVLCNSSLTGINYCAECNTTSYNCITCNPGYYQKYAPLGLYENCGACSVGCSNCTNSTNCLTCNTGLNLESGSCVSNSTCTSGQYILAATGLCDYCNETGLAIVNGVCTPNITATVSVTLGTANTPIISATCSNYGYQVFYVFGIGNIVSSLSFATVMAMAVSNGLRNEVSSNDTLYYIGYGSSQLGSASGSNSFNLTIDTVLKNSGETYTISLWCLSSWGNYYSSPATNTWVQPSNGGKPLVISINISASLTEAQTILLGTAFLTTAKLNRPLYTASGDLCPYASATSARILQNATGISYTMLPNYTATTDNTSSIVSAALNSSNFITGLTSTFQSLSSTSITVTSTPTFVQMSTTTASGTPPTFTTNYPTIVFSNNSATIPLTMTTSGTIYCGASTSTAYNASLVMTAGSITFSALSGNQSLTNLTEITVSANTSVSCVVYGLNASLGYNAYYAGINTGIPPYYTAVYGQYVNGTSGSSSVSGNTSSGNTSTGLRKLEFVLGIMIIGMLMVLG